MNEVYQNVNKTISKYNYPHHFNATNIIIIKIIIPTPLCLPSAIGSTLDLCKGSMADTLSRINCNSVKKSFKEVSAIIDYIERLIFRKFYIQQNFLLSVLVKKYIF